MTLRLISTIQAGSEDLFGRLEMIESGPDEGKLSRECCCPIKCITRYLCPVGFADPTLKNVTEFEIGDLCWNRYQHDGSVWPDCDDPAHRHGWHVPAHVDLQVRLSRIGMGGTRLLHDPSWFNISPWAAPGPGMFVATFYMMELWEGHGPAWSLYYGETPCCDPLAPPSYGGIGFSMTADEPDILHISTGGWGLWQSYIQDYPITDWERIELYCPYG